MDRMTVLSPWGEVDLTDASALAPRLDSLEGKTIGMFSHFKGHSPLILKEVEAELAKRWPTARFSYLMYPKDTKEIQDDPEFLPVFQQWLSQVDGVIAAYGDAGSCAMFHAFNTAYAEKLGKPSVLLVKRDIMNSAKRGAASRHIPHLRMVPCELLDLSFVPALDEALVENTIRPAVRPCAEALADALTRPLTEEEKTIVHSDVNRYADMTLTGTVGEINDQMYCLGWTNGAPVIPPTRQAVDEMLRGTPLPPDCLVAELPPMRGRATVEKIAVNAVMAGCLPTYMPILIAAVKAMTDPCLHLVGWTCSVAGFAPLILINGPICRQIGLNCSNNILSPYWKANATIGRALSFIIMNISGVRPTLEDNSYTGHEGRFGVCIGEDDDHCPWPPAQTRFGFGREDSTVTLNWYSGRTWFNKATTAEALLKTMCTADDQAGFAGGCTYVISPRCADLLAQAGYSRDDVRAYISEYARKSAVDVKVRWIRDNNHMQRGAILPADPDCSCRKFWNTDHLNVFVAGSDSTPRGVMFTGGGDHGGPACAAVELPENWDELVAQYAKLRPNYIEY